MPDNRKNQGQQGKNQGNQGDQGSKKQGSQGQQQSSQGDRQQGNQGQKKSSQSGRSTADDSGQGVRDLHNDEDPMLELQDQGNEKINDGRGASQGENPGPKDRKSGGNS